MTPRARCSIGGSAFDNASQRLDGEGKFKSTGLAKMFAGRMFVTSDWFRGCFCLKFFSCVLDFGAR